MTYDSSQNSLRDFLHRLSKWDVLNLAQGSGDDGPYWQEEIRKANDLLDNLLKEVEKDRDYAYHLLDEAVKRANESEARVELMERLVRWHYPNTDRALVFARTLPPMAEETTS